MEISNFIQFFDNWMLKQQISNIVIYILSGIGIFLSAVAIGLLYHFAVEKYGGDNEKSEAILDFASGFASSFIVPFVLDVFDIDPTFSVINFLSFWAGMVFMLIVHIFRHKANRSHLKEKISNNANISLKDRISKKIRETLDYQGE